VLSLRAYGVQQDQRRPRSTREVTQTTMASGSWPERVKKVFGGSWDADS